MKKRKSEPTTIPADALLASVQSLPVTFETPTRGEAFTQACRLAADLEKRGNYAAAQAHWEEGMALAMTHIDRHWCDARASLCKRRANCGNTEVDSIWLRALRD